MRKSNGIFVVCALLAVPGGSASVAGTKEQAPLVKGVVSQGTAFTMTAVKKPADKRIKAFVVETHYDKSIGRILMRHTNIPVDDRDVVLTWSPIRQVSPKIGPSIGGTYAAPVFGHLVAGWDVAYKRLWLTRLWTVCPGDLFQTIDEFDCYRLADYQRGKLLRNRSSLEK